MYDANGNTHLCSFFWSLSRVAGGVYTTFRRVDVRGCHGDAYRVDWEFRVRVGFLCGEDEAD